jgi:hypothetical protein
MLDKSITNNQATRYKSYQALVIEKISIYLPVSYAFPFGH